MQQWRPISRISPLEYPWTQAHRYIDTAVPAFLGPITGEGATRQSERRRVQTSRQKSPRTSHRRLVQDDEPRPVRLHNYKVHREQSNATRVADPSGGRFEVEERLDLAEWSGPVCLLSVVFRCMGRCDYLAPSQRTKSRREPTPTGPSPAGGLGAANPARDRPCRDMACVVGMEELLVVHRAVGSFVIFIVVLLSAPSWFRHVFRRLMWLRMVKQSRQTLGNHLQKQTANKPRTNVPHAAIRTSNSMQGMVASLLHGSTICLDKQSPS
jgi:hypothetical protein